MDTFATLFDTYPWTRILGSFIFVTFFAWAYFRLSKGTGITIFVLLSIGFGITINLFPIILLFGIPIVVLLLILVEVDSRRYRKPYVVSTTRFEGGGIKRGLTPQEAAVLLGKPLNKILGLIIIGLIRKEFVYIGESAQIKLSVSQPMRTRMHSIDANKRAVLRRKGAQSLGKVLYKFEEPFLELVEQEEGKNITEIDFGIVIKPLFQSVARRLMGYDIEHTRQYYIQLLARANQEVRFPDDFGLSQERAFHRNLEWMLLEDNFVTLLESEGIEEPKIKSQVEIPISSLLLKLETVLISTISDENFKFLHGRELDNISATLLRDSMQAIYHS